MSPYESLIEDLRDDRVIVIDGATGTELERRGAEMHDRAWSAQATLTSPELLRGVHEDYIRAGARVIIANTFSTNRIMLEPAGLADRFEELNRAAVRIAREARDRSGAAERVVVAGSLSHQVPVLGGADRRDTSAVPAPEIAAERFAEMARLLADAGAEMIMLEMMSDPALANPAIDAARAVGLPFWVGFSVRADAGGRPVSYALPGLPAAEMFRAIPADGADAAGIMHSNVTVTGAAIDALRATWSGPIFAYPDSGYFKMPHWQFENIIPPAELVEHARTWVASGARVLGGCCGLGVEHVEALAREWPS